MERGGVGARARRRAAHFRELCCLRTSAQRLICKSAPHWYYAGTAPWARLQADCMRTSLYSTRVYSTLALVWHTRCMQERLVCHTRCIQECVQAGNQVATSLVPCFESTQDSCQRVLDKCNVAQAPSCALFAVGDLFACHSSVFASCLYCLLPLRELLPKSE